MAILAIDGITIVQRNVYYIVHWESMTRLKYYTTRAGARIACRLRNQHLGFKTRLAREHNDAFEYEMYSIEGMTVAGTYCILEDSIEQCDLSGPAA